MAEKVKAKDVSRLPTQKAFKSLIDDLEALEQNAKSANGEMGALIKKAANEQFFDKHALRLFRSLKRVKDNRKLATTMAHLAFYCDIGGLDERAEEQGDMIEREETDAGTEAGKVVRGKFTDAVRQPGAPLAGDPPSKH